MDILMKRLIVFESEIYKFVSSAKIEISLLELLQRSLISKKNKIGLRKEPCDTPQVILQYMLFSILSGDTNCCQCFE